MTVQLRRHRMRLSLRDVAMIITLYAVLIGAVAIVGLVHVRVLELP